MLDVVDVKPADEDLAEGVIVRRGWICSVAGTVPLASLWRVYVGCSRDGMYVPNHMQLIEIGCTRSPGAFHGTIGDARERGVQDANRCFTNAIRRSIKTEICLLSLLQS